MNLKGSSVTQCMLFSFTSCPKSMSWNLEHEAVPTDNTNNKVTELCITPHSHREYYGSQAARQAHTGVGGSLQAFTFTN
ncbi:hypothetical protein E2C01_068703 [Portunus trituberculatus]|uniref:Uncharacterized protein n=1 Tax=Portunus trituberculatus TaxID=210409 RepID=A0A5B7HWW3_PORTR|nr:hypothetical protein [Portunus trituberculatus]